MTKTEQWDCARSKLKAVYLEKGITSCEAGLKGCWRNNALSFHHKKRRQYYWAEPELLGDFDQTILVCTSCHSQLQNNKELSDYIFKREGRSIIKY